VVLPLTFLPGNALCLCLCNAGIAASRSIWVSFVHVHLVHTHPYLGLGRADAAQSEASSVQDGFLTHKWLGLAWFCDNLQAHLTPLMRRLGNKPSLFLRFLLALFTDSHAKFSASSSGARRQIVIPDVCFAYQTQGVRSGGDQVPRRGGRHQFQLGGLPRRHEAGEFYCNTTEHVATRRYVFFFSSI